MSEYRCTSYIVSNLSCHIVWATKYRYSDLREDIQERCRDLLIQICNSENVQILKGVVSKDHVRMYAGYPPSMSISLLIKMLKGPTFHHLQQKYPELRKRYWSQHFLAISYGVWRTGRITNEMVQEYLEHRRDNPNTANSDWILT